ncbi:hypothetical protein LDENG_00149750 [Lucifuga dentata]|nr:hypothetical protein LDENG_00149750 [Lucifuga dentata]
MKCCERLVLKHMKTCLSPRLAPVYGTNRSTEDAITSALHTTLSHLEHQGTYVRMLFIDHNSTFNTTVPSRKVTEMSDLCLSQPTCWWIKDILTNHPQTIRLAPHLSSILTLSTGAPQGCRLMTVPTHPANTIIKFAADTTVVGLISDGDETRLQKDWQ